MNEPIISPYIIYLLSIVDTLRGISFVITLSMFTALLFAPAWTDGFTEYMKHLKRIFIVLIVSGIFLIFIPSSDVITKMLIAQHVTPQNIQMIGDGIDKSVDKVIEKIINYQTKLKESK